ncbi:MAG: dockerin type I repeat-containing protein [Phycisphaerales bacterium]
MRWSIRAHNGYYPRGAVGIADGFIYEIQHRSLTAGNIALTIIDVSVGNIFFDADNFDAYNVSDRTPALFAHEEDRLFPNVLDSGMARKRTPWMIHGIAEGTAWMQAFVNRLHCSVVNETIPAPNRFLFDDEPSDILAEASTVDDALNLGPDKIQNVVDYWQNLRDDDRFDSEPVPGFGTQTLADLWDLALLAEIGPPYVPANASPPEYFSTHYPGGTEANARWVVWFRNLMRQAEAGAMQTAFYDTIHDKFPSAKCSDYDRSIRLDGVGTNKYISGNQNGADGIYYAWDGFGDLQAPCLYPQAGPYFYDTAYCPDPYARINDTGNNLDWCPYEPIGIFSSRINRYTLDAIARSSSGAHKSTLAPWVQLPGQGSFFSGSDPWVVGCGEYVESTRFYGTHGAGIYHYPSVADVRRTLAQVRAHGSCEFNIWNNDNFGLNPNDFSEPAKTDVTYLNDQVHPQHNYSWSRMQSLIDQVWAFNVYSAHVSAGTAESTSGTVHRLAEDVGDYLTIQRATSGTYGSDVQTTLLNAYATVHVTTPSRLRVNVEVASTTDATLLVWIKNFNTNSWESVNLDPTEMTTTAAQIFHGTNANTGVSAVPGPTKRVSAPIEVTSDNFGTMGEVIIRTATQEIGTSTGTKYDYYDLVQVIVEDDDDFLPGDLNLDGVVNCDDVTLWTHIYAAATEHPAIFSLADVNRDGAVNATDDNFVKAIWCNAELTCTGLTCP